MQAVESKYFYQTKPLSTIQLTHGMNLGNPKTQQIVANTIHTKSTDHFQCKPFPSPSSQTNKWECAHTAAFTMNLKRSNESIFTKCSWVRHIKLANSVKHFWWFLFHFKEEHLRGTKFSNAAKQERDDSLHLIPKRFVSVLQYTWTSILISYKYVRNRIYWLCLAQQLSPLNDMNSNLQQYNYRYNNIFFTARLHLLNLKI